MHRYIYIVVAVVIDDGVGNATNKTETSLLEVVEPTTLNFTEYIDGSRQS